MSLMPYAWEWEDPNLIFRPSRILDQHFGSPLDPDDLLQPLTIPNMLTRSPAGYLRNWRSLASEVDKGSTLKFDKDKFEANLDVSQFKPEEISVKVTGDNVVTIEGKHEEKEDEHGQISRHFVRKYVLPKNCDLAKVESKLSSDGVLTLTAPTVREKQIKHKSIPVKKTGKPAKSQKFREDSKKCSSRGGADADKKCKNDRSCCKK